MKLVSDFFSEFKNIHNLILLGLVTSFYVAIEPSLTDLLWFAAVLTLAIHFMLNLSKQSFWFYFNDSKLILAGFLLIFTGLLSGAMTSPNKMSSLVTLYCLSLYFLGINLARVKISSLIKSFDILGVLLFSSAVLAVISLYFYPISDSLHVFGTAGRINAGFKDPNVYGPFALAFAIYFFDRIKNKYFYPVHLITFTLTILSSSRSVYISAVLFSVWLMIRSGFKKSVLFVVTFILAIFLAKTFQVTAHPADTRENISTRMNYKSYDNDRIQNWKHAVSSFAEFNIQQKLFGDGPGWFKRNSFQEAHQFALQVLMQYGLVGLVGLLLIIFGSLKKISLRFIRTNKHLTSLLLSYILITLVCGLFIDTLHWRHFWLFLGLLAGLNKNWIEQVRQDNQDTTTQQGLTAL